MATLRPKLATTLTIVGAAYTIVVWVAAPLVVAERLVISGLVGMLVGIGLIAACLWASTKEDPATEWRRCRKPKVTQ